MKHLTKILLAALSLSGATLTAAVPAGPRKMVAVPAPGPAGVAVASTGFDHSAFDRLLHQHVNPQGLVDYPGFQADEKLFNQYLAALSQNPPPASAPQPEQLAYWINAYNAFTIRLILDHYPLQSIKDIGTKIQIPFVTTPWAAKFFRIGGEKMSLDGIEHGILRKRYHDPRIHFALVCASISCPPLRREAYAAARLDEQLDAQGRAFINNTGKNKVGKGSAQLSKYFDWYKADWEQNGQSVVKWVNRYSTTKLDDHATISFLDYNWNLNKQ